MKRVMLAFALSLGGFLAAGGASAEPWLSTRYAQNCAGCHAPGRKNLQPADRRCTLSCQGCHVNPNGGGLRSLYGKWNEDRWLRSFRVDQLRHASAFAPTGKQHYGRGDKKKKKEKGDKDEKGGDDEVDAEKDGKEGKKAKRRLAKRRKPGAKGFPLVEIENDVMPEQLYLRDGLEFEISETREEFMYQIPQRDPLRELESQKTLAGGDIRYQIANLRRGDAKQKWSSFLMSADFSLEHRPLYRNLHFVYEARIQGTPSEEATYESVLTKANTRSLYAMVDDLPYNVFVMGGYYRPLFGNFIPDHYALPQLMTTYAMTGQTKNYSVLFNALSIGTAPNVPYLNVHVIRKLVGDKDDKTEGFAANTGMRFVTLGASLNYSYWRTEDKRPGRKTGVEMHSIGGAARVWRVVAGFDAVSLSRDVDAEDFRQGGVMTLDTFTQLWRENYFTFQFSKANTTSALTPGDANQVKIGGRSFLIPGVDFQLGYEITDETVKDTVAKTSTKVKTKGYTGQLHMFF